jgi:hypothetical protein
MEVKVKKRLHQKTDKKVEATKPPTEKAIENSILDYLATIPGCRAWKNQTTGIYDPNLKMFRPLHGKYSGKGSSDILACINGRFVAIEVKRPVGSTIRAEQVEFVRDIIRCGGVAFFATSIEDTREKLRFFGIIN